MITMTRSLTFAVAAAAMALAASGCLELEHKSSLAGPTQISDLKSLLGTWSSASVLPSADSCSDFKWEVTEQSGASASGNFTATCPGGLQVSGRASGTQLGTVISWTATGAATAPGLPSCAISLTGNAYLEVSQIRVPYSGQTCLGAVKGEEILKRN
jgi:hypothetical protein